MSEYIHSPAVFTANTVNQKCSLLRLGASLLCNTNHLKLQLVCGHTVRSLQPFVVCYIWGFFHLLLFMDSHSNKSVIKEKLKCNLGHMIYYILIIIQNSVALSVKNKTSKFNRHCLTWSVLWPEVIKCDCVSFPDL